MGKRWILLGVLTILFANGCDTFPSDHLIGVTISSNDQVQIHFVPCHEHLVLELKLYSIWGQFAADADDLVLWSIASDQAVDQRSFTLGVAPARFRTLIAFTRTPNLSEHLYAMIETSGGPSSGVGFTLGELSPGLIHTSGKDLDAATFEGEAAGFCR